MIFRSGAYAPDAKCLPARHTTAAEMNVPPAEPLLTVSH
jgi:hypothetical protein